MARDTTSDQRLSTFTAAADLSPATSLAVMVGAHRLDLRATAGHVELTAVAHATPATARQSRAKGLDVARWSDSSSLLLRTDLPVNDDEGVELRTPMLMLEPQTCLALAKRMKRDGATYQLSIGRTPEELTAGELVVTCVLSPEEAQGFLTALRRVAAAALDPSPID